MTNAPSSEPDDTDPGITAGADTLIDVLSAAADAGFEAQFVAVEGGSIRCTGCGISSPAGNYDVSRTDRLEGASDAADMMLVARATCPSCGRGGTIVVGYGPNASDHDIGVLDGLDLPDSPADPTQN